MVRLVHPLKKDTVWRLRDQGACLCFQGEEPVACFIFYSPTADDLNSFAQSIKADWQFKLIGSSAFVRMMSSKIKELNQKVIKEIDRSGSFELIYSEVDKKFRVSAQDAAQSGVSTTVPVTPAQPVASAPVPGRAPSNVSSPSPAAVSTSSSVQQDKVKVLIVDDSKTVRDLLTKILSSDPLVEVIGAVDLPSKVEPFIDGHRPDVITLDIHMPEMDGVQLLRRILPKYRIPTIMISSLSEEDGPFVFDALELGAFDYIKKPSFQEISQVGAFILERIKLAGRLGARRSGKIGSSPAAAPSMARAPSGERWVSGESLLLIGSSTGGTEALKQLFLQFPDEIPPTLVVQHIPPIFSKALADRLNSIYKFTVKEAQDGDLVCANQVLIAPGGKQMGVKQRGSELHVYVTDDAPVNRHKPSVDFLFDSACKLKDASSLIGVILTGMGSDGARGLKALKERGAHTIGQDEESCVVYGMPKAAYEMGALTEVKSLSKIGEAIGKQLSNKGRKPKAS